MPSRLTVMFVSLLLATPALIFWLWLVILPVRVTEKYPDECDSDIEGSVHCNGPSLTAVPLINLTDIRELSLQYNNITLLERDCFVSRRLTDLHLLHIVWCGLRKIELGAFNGLKNLSDLVIAGNEISEIIPDTFENMSNLVVLDLDYNRLKHLDTDVFSGLFNLKFISLVGNKLQYLHPDTFLGLQNIQYILLHKNPSLQIPTDLNFIKSHSLSHLSIPHCNISSVSVHTFANVRALKSLYLSYNNLTTVGIKILTALPKLSELYLHGNPLQCDCQLQEVWRLCEDRNIETAFEAMEPQCDTTSEVEGVW